VTEEEMKTKECPKLFHTITIVATMMRAQGASDSVMDELKGRSMCTASQCAMWEPEYELESKQIVKGEDIPKGWHIVSNDIDYKQTIGRHIKISSGDCGLKTKETGCFYPG